MKKEPDWREIAETAITVAIWLAMILVGGIVGKC